MSRVSEIDQLYEIQSFLGAPDRLETLYCIRVGECRQLSQIPKLPPRSLGPS